MLALAGLVLVARPAEASCIPGFDYAIFADGAIAIQGQAGTDSYDSSLGTYADTHACADSDVGTNSTAGGELHVQALSTTICGDAMVGAGGDPGSVITGNGTITGTRTAQSQNTPMPDVTVPSLPSGSPFSPSYTNSDNTLPADRTYGAVTCKNGSLTLNAGRYVVESITLTSNCELRVGSGPIEVYFTKSLAMQAGVIVNDTDIPGNLVFYGGPGADAVQVQGGVSASFAIYAPAASCQLQGNADLYGALVCQSVQVQGNAKVHYDRALRSLGGGGFACTLEVSRASPVVTTIANTTAVVQGTFVAPTGARTKLTSVASIASFAFPYIQGHMRARAASTIGTTASSFSSGTILFDAGASGSIPPASPAGCSSVNGSCRNVFTITSPPGTSGVQLHPAMVQLNTANASAIGALIAPTSAVPGIDASGWATIVGKVLAAPLGGVDRSTVAVIEPSPLAGVASRPTMAYFGGTDGMLHAVCASTGGTTASGTNVCPSLGTELWAFIPRTQLPLIRTNTARVDGSARVIDAFGDFGSPATGTRSWHTILILQTGFAVGTTASAYAIDITDPASPVVLWEYATPDAPGTLDLGTGLTVAAGPAFIGHQQRNIAVLQTSNGGAGGAGVVATAVSLETGAKLWQFGYLYPSPPRGQSADLPLPASGIPGGAVGVDLVGQGALTDVVFGDLYGNFWRLNVADGASRNGAGIPLFSFSTNRHPIGAAPAIYSDGNRQFAAFASGGYVDPIATSWSSTTQYLIAVRLDSTASTVDETAAPCASCALALNTTLTSGDRGFSQLLVVGTQLFLTSDSSDVNSSSYGQTADTGHVTTVDLTGAQPSTVVAIASGGSSLASSGTNLYSSSSSQQQQVTSAASTTGVSVDLANHATVRRLLWLESE